ncbi:hypothetical protein BLGI_575 [Brevibacillus laterosporus GI-9]|nr:hypothetical protein BLGI_575 [Brevibacillus laterosporus GI-9]
MDFYTVIYKLLGRKSSFCSIVKGMKNNQHNHTLLVLKHLLITQKAHKYKLFTKLVDFVSEEQELENHKTERMFVPW